MVDAVRLNELENAIRARRGDAPRPPPEKRAKPGPKGPHVFKRREARLHTWKVQCPSNEHLSTLVTSPIRPNYCPVCGKPSHDIKERP